MIEKKKPFDEKKKKTFHHFQTILQNTAILVGERKKERNNCLYDKRDRECCPDLIFQENSFERTKRGLKKEKEICPCMWKNQKLGLRN